MEGDGRGKQPPPVRLLDHITQPFTGWARDNMSNHPVIAPGRTRNKLLVLVLHKAISLALEADDLDADRSGR